MKKYYTVQELKVDATASHYGNTYVVSSAQFPDEMEDDRHLVRQLRSHKETCDSDAAKNGKKVKYYHIALLAVYE